MAKVVLTQYEKEHFTPEQQVEYLISKFKKQVEKESIILECKKREYALTKSQKRREKRKQNETKRNRK
jgi:ribosomal protein S21